MVSLAVPGRWLRHKKDGTIYGYSEHLVNNPAVEEISEEEAFPERHIPEGQEGRKSGLALSTSDEAATEAETKAKPKKPKKAVAADASRGLKT